MKDDTAIVDADNTLMKSLVALVLVLVGAGLALVVVMCSSYLLVRSSHK